MEALRKQSPLVQVPDFPELQDFVQELMDSFYLPDNPNNALQFIPAFQKLNGISIKGINQLRNAENESIVLVQNEFLKVVLIYWPDGKKSSIHGHPKGGCLFKVLHGGLEEVRYTTDSQHVLSKTDVMSGGMAYIDDNMGFHAVGNNNNKPAISIHAYTPGIS